LLKNQGTGDCNGKIGICTSIGVRRNGIYITDKVFASVPVCF